MNDKDKKIPSKFKEVTGFSFTTYGGELMIVFSGFEEETDLPEFADFLFKKIKMNYINAGQDLSHQLFINESYNTLYAKKAASFHTQRIRQT